MVIDVVIQSNSNIRKKEHGKLTKFPMAEKRAIKNVGVKATEVPVIIGALGAVTHNLGE